MDYIVARVGILLDKMKHHLSYLHLTASLPEINHRDQMSTLKENSIEIGTPRCSSDHK